MIAFFFLNPQSKKRLQKITEPARVIMCDNIRGPLLLFTKKNNPQVNLPIMTCDKMSSLSEVPGCDAMRRLKRELNEGR